MSLPLLKSKYFRAAGLFLKLCRLNRFYVFGIAMSFDILLRGALDTLIDQTIQNMSFLADSFKTTKPKELRVENMHDFLLGWSYGYTLSAFKAFHMMTYGTSLDANGLKEAFSIMYRRTPEFREAIFVAGFTSPTVSHQNRLYKNG
jgi:hypothetical protein